MKKIVVFRSGENVERPTGNGTPRSPLSYRWARGYNRIGRHGEVYYPAVTRREACEEARREGATAKFV